MLLNKCETRYLLISIVAWLHFTITLITLANDSDDLYDADREALAGPPSPDHRAQSRILRLASICLSLAKEQ